MLPQKIDVQVIKSASERGVAYASWLMSVLCRSGTEIEMSRDDSLRYLKTAVTQGSLRAKRDLALIGLSGGTSDLPKDREVRMIIELLEKRFDRPTLGRKLLLMRDPSLAKLGYEALKEYSRQELDYNARYLTALYEALGEGICESNEDNLQLLYYQKSRGNDDRAAKRALALASLLGIYHQQCSLEQIIEKLLEAESAEAAADALQLLGSEKFKSCNPELKNRAFKQVEAFALSGDVYAEVIYTAQLLFAARPENEGDLALHLMNLLVANPQYHFQELDGLLHGCKAHDKRVVPAMFETSRKLSESGLSPNAYRTFGIELLIADKEDDAKDHLLRCVDYGVPGSVRPLVGCFGKQYVEQGKNYDDTRFWHEVMIWEHAETGAEMLEMLLDSKSRRGGLNHDEILSLKHCLEVLNSNDDADATRKLALLLLKGDGPVLPDQKRGLQLLNKAAKSDGRAMYELAHIYQAGVLVPRDFCLAKYFFELAAKNGHSNAIYDQFAAQRTEAEKSASERNDAINLDNVTELFIETNRPPSENHTLEQINQSSDAT